MLQLRKDISRIFIIYALLLSVIESIIDSVFDGFLFVRFEQNESLIQMLLAVYVILSIATFILFTFLFTKTISKKISNEMHRQMEERNMLFANIAHDLKTPITSILGFSRALKEKDMAKEKKLQVVDTIYEKSKRTSELIDMMFYYTKLQTDGYKLQCEALDICRLTRDILASQYEMIKEYGMDLEVEIPEDKITYPLDKVEYTRVINNLLVNACIHNERGCTVLVKIEEENDKGKKKLLIVVADNGVKITSELRDTMFQAFASGDESRSSKGGSGLGLSISKSIVEKHGGNLLYVEPYNTYTKSFVIELKR
jgi:signal transduction histidine kinase